MRISLGLSAANRDAPGSMATSNAKANKERREISVMTGSVHVSRMGLETVCRRPALNLFYRPPLSAGSTKYNSPEAPFHRTYFWRGLFRTESRFPPKGHVRGMLFL